MDPLNPQSSLPQLRNDIQREKDEHSVKVSTTTATPAGIGNTSKDVPHQAQPTTVRANRPPVPDPKTSMPVKITTVAEINVCEKHFHLSQQLLPLLTPPNIKREDNTTEKDEKDERTTELKETSVPLTEMSTSRTPAIPSQSSSKHEKDEHVLPSPDETETENIEEPPRQSETNETETDEHTMDAADGLLMLQELANFDEPDVDDDINSQLMPIGLKRDLPVEEPADLMILNDEDKEDGDNDNTSEETVIYDVPAPTELRQTRYKNTRNQTKH